MTKQIHSGIAAGQVPEGYKLEHGYVIPKEWKVVHFNKCFHRLTQKNIENNQNVLTISAQQGLISQLDYYNTLYASEDKTGYFLLQKGDFAYNKSYSADYANGALKQLEKYDKGIVSPLYICFSANEGTNTDFYRQYFESGMFNREIYKIAQEGARNHGLLNVSTPEFFSAALVFPPVEEQKKITEVLSCCDRVIESKQQLIAELQRLKSGFLQVMFPTKGHSEPDIRFPEFSDAWEQRKFGELAEYKKGPFGSAITKDMFVPKNDESVKVYEQQNAINKDWSLERYFLPKEYALTKLKSFEVHGGDIIVSCAGTIGEIYEIPNNADSGVINQALMRVRVNENIVNKKMFIIAFLNMIDEFTRTHSNGSAIKNIPPFADLKPMEVLVPSMDEQKKISEHFSSLDNLITLHQRELEETKKKKKSLAKLLLTGSVRVPT